MIRCKRNVSTSVFDHAQHRLENAAHGRNVPSLLIPCGGQRVVVPEQLVRSVDQMNVHKATPARNYRNPPISINRHRATTSDRPLTSGNRDRVTNRLKKNLPLPVFDSRGDLFKTSAKTLGAHFHREPGKSAVTVGNRPKTVNNALSCRPQRKARR